MDYSAHYARLIERAKARELVGYCERHHIIPKCIGGSDDAGNIVRLTAEEHYLAHQLLVKMYPGNHKLVWAVHSMTRGSYKTAGRVSNKLYGWLRRKVAEARKSRTPPMLGKRHSAETRAKMSVAATGKRKTPEHCAAISRSKTGKRRGPHSAEHRARLSEAIKTAMAKVDRAYMSQPEYRGKQAENMRRVWAERKALEA